jgi:flagellar biosynthesis/type III secretory pathway M-ring protein FliF/YscJ
MFEDLNWKWAARRAAVVIGIYLALLYVLSTVAPQTFSLQDRGQIMSLFINAFFFFIIFTFVYAYVDRSRRRRMTETSKKPERSEGSGAEPGALKGRPNPNTSRKKARRRR